MNPIIKELEDKLKRANQNELEKVDAYKEIELKIRILELEQKMMHTDWLNEIRNAISQLDSTLGNRLE